MTVIDNAQGISTRTRLWSGHTAGTQYETEHEHHERRHHDGAEHTAHVPERDVGEDRSSAHHGHQPPQRPAL